jgi:nucleotide-binding universal stress UspA family protein
MRDVLVIARNCETWQPHVHYAADLAAKYQGSLRGIYLSPRSIPVPADAPAAFAKELVEIYREEAMRAARADLPFGRWAAGHGVRHSAWHVAYGAPVAVLEAAANWHDVLVLETSPEPSADDVLDIGSTLLRVDIPCLLVPPHVDTFTLNTVAVAWNGSAQATRAVHSALPLLREAKRIVVIQVGKPDAQGEDSLDRYFEWHQLRCEHMDIDAHGTDDGAAILNHSRYLSADMLVLGAYGRGRFSEWFFGGVTRHVLEHAALPLFMHH